MTYESPVTVPIKFLGPFHVHPSAAVHEVAEDIDKGFFDDLLADDDGLRVPAELRQCLFRLFQLFRKLSIVRRPRGDGLGDRGAELKRGAERSIRTSEPCR